MTGLLRCLKKITVLICTVSILLACCSVLIQLDVSAVVEKVYNPVEDIDYTSGEGANVVLRHKKDEKAVAKYEIEDSRITRNATLWMSMSVKFDNPWSWGIRLRNVTCKVKGEEITGDLVFRFFAKSGVAQVGDTTVGIEKWATYKDIGDNKWHKLVICSSVDNISVWIDGYKAKGTYFSSDVEEIKSNYMCPQIFMSGYNSGAIKNICIWNNGKTENPIMPADRVIRDINSLPDAAAIVDNDTEKIKRVESDYNKLSATEKTYVTNHSRLEQILLAMDSKNHKIYDLEVSGTKKGDFSKVFPNGSITHKLGDDTAKYIFESDLSRNSEYYIQFSVDFNKAHCFDVYLRNQEHLVDEKKISGMISIRMFDAGAVVLDSKDNHLSSYINYKPGLMSGVHTVTVRSAPDSCSFWIDGDRYDFDEYLLPNGEDSASVTEYDCIEAKPGFMLGKSEEWGAFGTIGNISVFNDGINNSLGQNRYSIGDKARISILNLCELNKLTLSDKVDIFAARSLCDELSEQEQKYVTNISKLESLERAIEFIEQEGEFAFNFLYDSMPIIKEDDINLVSSGGISVPVEYNDAYTFNRNTNELSFLVSDQYINAKFEDLKGISAEDSYIIRFNYTPYEYYYETESAAWMGLRVTFADYEVGGNGAVSKNKNQFAFMVNDSGIITVANGVTLPVDTVGSADIEIGKTHQVTMLCKSGKLKVWVNGRAIAYFDDLAEYGPALEFESSRCRCDITNIQLYNFDDKAPSGIAEETKDVTKIINDILYDEEGKLISGYLETEKFILICVVAVLVVILAIAVSLVIYIAKKKKNVVSDKNKG